jgi:hypothetical protein
VRQPFARVRVLGSRKRDANGNFTSCRRNSVDCHKETDMLLYTDNATGRFACAAPIRVFKRKWRIR